MNSSPLFILVGEEGVSVFSRFFGFFQWLQDVNGDPLLDCRFDLHKMKRFPPITRFHLNEMKWFESESIVTNLPGLLFGKMNQSNQSSCIGGDLLRIVNKESLCFEINDDSLVSKEKESVSFCLEEIWTEYLDELFRMWCIQNTDIPNSIIIVLPNYCSEDSATLMKESCNSALTRTGSSMKMDSVKLLFMKDVVHSTSRYHIQLVLSESVVYASLLSDRTILTSICYPISDSSDILTSLTNRITSSFSLSRYNELFLKRSIRLQCDHYLNHLSNITLDSSEKVLFSVTLNDHLCSKRSFDVTSSLLKDCFSICEYGVLVNQILREVSNWIRDFSLDPIEIYLDGVYSRFNITQQRINQILPSARLVNQSLSERGIMISEVTNELYPSICNNFAFLDHNLNLAIQDGFSTQLFSRGTSLPASTETSLYFNLTRTSTVTLMLLRGDSYKQEENAVVISQAFQYTHPIEECVRITIQLSLDSCCNCSFTIRDSFGQIKTVSLSAHDFFNSSIERTHNDLYKSTPPPICSRPSYSYYQGEMREFRPEGYGRFFNSSNTLKYEGSWKSGHFDGFGTYYFCSGNVYEGQFNKGLLHGPGILFDNHGIVIDHRYFDQERIDDPPPSTPSPLPFPSNTQTIQPVFSSSTINGHGTVCDEHGIKVYEGELIDGVYHGNGSLFSKGYLVYKGEFVNGLYHGKGTLFYPSGAIKCRGNFQKGKLNGYCEFFHDSTPFRLKSCGFYFRGKREGFGEDYSESGIVTYSGYFYHDAPTQSPLVLRWGLLSDAPQILLPSMRSFQTLFNRTELLVAMNGVSIAVLKTIVKNPQIESLSIVSRNHETILYR
ncbi:hypothetical protein JH06_0603 [Blastocystis sp. subtype 4]|uniref:hypothetical protein n=1 Tax=Blastocystis sp. subtype 4 TaxID=944170 RepID=UPI00071228F1|nr:hypothetical protein JH06_0603 [Blastocystis sp. subtype 4]KNB46728.1 hypothetical protein JH06_0603 [Blastocystis sp. subtype 4]|eukprot:XP_014530171.1 hypothetical protein JH06_0603 [Blastocystis sp. subtype 4]